MIRIPGLDRNNIAFPAVETALTDPNGLLAMGGDLSPQRLLFAYCLGIFPWYEAGQPILWWSPNPRCVIYPNQLSISKSLKKSFRNKGYRCTCDQQFSQVLTACAGPRAKSSGTWINQDMKLAYERLFQMGIAHSVEIWSEDELIGGLYGLCIGPFFFGESMFSHKTDASKIALIYLRENLVKQGLKLIDCQVENPHLMSLGAKLIPRETFCQLLDTHLSPMRATIFKGVFESSQTKCDDAISIWPSEWQIPDI